MRERALSEAAKRNLWVFATAADAASAPVTVNDVAKRMRLLLHD